VAVALTVLPTKPVEVRFAEGQSVILPACLLHLSISVSLDEVDV
jgi:hypothetical protein